MTRTDFIELVKGGIHYQRLAGDIMTYIEWNNTMACPFCGKPMKSKLTKQKLESLTCDCTKAVEANRILNEQIKIIEDAQDKVQEIFKTIDNHALDVYKSIYTDLIVPQLYAQLTKEREEIINSTLGD
jgi:hypothetical protein